MAEYHSLVIGKVRIAKPVVVRHRGFETASWWEDRELQPGTYEVVADRQGIHAVVPSTVTDGYFGQYSTSKGVGQVHKHWVYFSPKSRGLSCNEPKDAVTTLSAQFKTVAKKLENGHVYHVIADRDGHEITHELWLLDEFPQNLSESGRVKRESARARWAGKVR